MKSLRTGQEVVLGKALTRGGQGVIYLTGDPGVLAKVYTAQDDPERYEKLKVMLDYPPADPTRESMNHISIAWPCDMLLEDGNRCVGFVMPHIQKALELTHVYNPVFRVRRAPKFNWYYLHCAAMNLASAVQALHLGKYVLGDIKPQNVLVTPNALISLIDTDSFQVASPRSGLRFRCPVGSEGFTPRELLEQLAGRTFREVDRTEIHDRFGLAVVVYLLLFGRHPFMEGRYTGAGEPPGPDLRVLRGQWAHLRGGEIARDPGTIPLDTVHPEIEQCFRRCFIEGYHEPAMRPTAEDWRKALKAGAEGLVACAAEPNHFHPRSAGACYWCERRARLKLDIFAPSAAPHAVRGAAIVPPVPDANRRSPFEGRRVSPGEWRLAAYVLAALFIIALAVKYFAPGADSRAVQAAPPAPPANTGSNRPPAAVDPAQNDDEQVLRELRSQYRAQYDALIQSMKQPRVTPADPQPTPHPVGPRPTPPLPQPGKEAEPATHLTPLATVPAPKGGYRYKVLMSGAGADAPFVMVAYPEKYSAGRKTYAAFKSKVYEKDLGPDTEEIVEAMREFSPDASWLAEE